MELVFAWIPLVVLTLAVLAIVVTGILRGRRDRDAAGVVTAAHTRRIQDLPEYRRAHRRATWSFRAMLVLLLGALAALSVVAARPITTEVRDTDLASRDIVLCLDVSGSMLDYDGEIVARFQELVEQFNGERIGLVIWNSSAAQLFPLTDDYRFVTEQLDDVAVAIDDATQDFWLGGGSGGDGGVDIMAGTLLGDGASLIGDGLASCVLRFDNPAEERSRTVILATDNQLEGEPIVTLAEAASFAVERDVQVFGISPGSLEYDVRLQELASELERTDGRLFGISQVGGTGEIVDEVLAEQATDLEGVPQLVVTDHPGLPLVLGVLALWVVVLVGWRLRT